MKGKGDRTSNAHLFGRFPDPFAIHSDIAGLDNRLRERSTFDDADAVEKAVDPHFAGLSLELGQLGKGMTGGAAVVGPLTAAAAPPPGVAGAGEADLVHQPRERIRIEAD